MKENNRAEDREIFLHILLIFDWESYYPEIRNIFGADLNKSKLNSTPSKYELPEKF